MSNLVAQYTFEPNTVSSTTVSNAAYGSPIIDATLTSATMISTAQSKFGTSSCYFDGTENTYVLLPPITVYGEFAFSFWIYPTSGSSAILSFDVYTDGNAIHNSSMYIDTIDFPNTLVFNINTGDTMYIPGIILNKWNFIALSYNYNFFNRILTIYLNSNLYVNAIVFPGNIIQILFTLGYSFNLTTNSDMFCSGYIDDIRIYKTSLSKDQIFEIYDQATFTNYYRFQTTTPSDLSGSTSTSFQIANVAGGYPVFDATVNNPSAFTGTTYKLDTTIQKTGNASLYVNAASGSSNYIILPSINNIDPSGVSLSFWVRPQATSGNSMLTSFGNSNYRWVISTVNAASTVDIAFELYTGTSTTPVSRLVTLTGTPAGVAINVNVIGVPNRPRHSGQLTQTRFIHVCWAITPTSWIIYIDGVATTLYNPNARFTTGTLGAGLVALPSTFTSNFLFRDPYVSMETNAYIDDVRFYNRVLSLDDIYKLYNYGTLRTGFYDATGNDLLTTFANGTSGSTSGYSLSNGNDLISNFAVFSETPTSSVVANTVLYDVSKVIVATASFNAVNPISQIQVGQLVTASSIPSGSYVVSIDIPNSFVYININGTPQTQKGATRTGTAYSVVNGILTATYDGTNPTFTGTSPSVGDLVFHTSIPAGTYIVSITNIPDDTGVPSITNAYFLTPSVALGVANDYTSNLTAITGWTITRTNMNIFICDLATPNGTFNSYNNPPSGQWIAFASTAASAIATLTQSLVFTQVGSYTLQFQLSGPSGTGAVNASHTFTASINGAASSNFTATANVWTTYSFSFSINAPGTYTLTLQSSMSPATASTMFLTAIEIMLSSSPSSLASSTMSYSLELSNKAINISSSAETVKWYNTSTNTTFSTLKTLSTADSGYKLYSATGYNDYMYKFSNASLTNLPYIATGTFTTENVGNGYFYLTFTAGSGTIMFINAYSVQVLIVGGGGAGGSGGSTIRGGGGGGGASVLFNLSSALISRNRFIYPLEVGMGGSISTSSGNDGGNGGASIFHVYSVNGGNGGYSGSSGANSGIGGTGGSTPATGIGFGNITINPGGNGANQNTVENTPLTGSPGQSYIVGTRASATYGTGGNSGGTDVVGANATANTGNGGNGGGLSFKYGGTGGSGVIVLYLGAVPDTPKNLVATNQTASSISLSFTPSRGVVSSYSLLIKSGSTTISIITIVASVSSFTATGLSSNTSYTFFLNAVNAVGISEPISATSSTYSSNIVAAPTNVSIIATTSTTISVSMQNSDQPVSYRVFASTSATTPAITTPTYSTSKNFIVLSGLSPNTAYTISVIAISALQTASSATTIAATTLNTPNSVSNFTLTPADTSITYSFLKPTQSNISSYSIYRDDLSSYTTSGLISVFRTNSFSSNPQVLHNSMFSANPSTIDAFLNGTVLPTFNVFSNKLSTSLAWYYKLTSGNSSGTGLYNQALWPAALTTDATMFGTPSFATTSGYNELVLSAASSQYVSLPSHTIGTGGLSFACWFRASSTASLSRIFDLGNGTNSYNITVYIKTNTLHYRFSGNGSDLVAETQISTTNVNTGSYFHFAFIIGARSGSTCSITAYLNGASVYTGTNIAYPTIITRTSNFIAKSGETTPNYLNGGMFDAMLWNRPITASEVSMLYANPNSPNFLSSIHDYELKLTAASSQYIFLPPLDLSAQGFSAACWFRSNASATGGNLAGANLFCFGQYVDTDHDYVIRVFINASGFLAYSIFNASNTATTDAVAITTTSCNDNIPRHFAITLTPVSGSTCSVFAYINGVQIYSGTNIAYPVRTMVRSACFVGRNSVTGGVFLNGAVSDIGVWTRRIMPAEVLWLYNARANNTPFTILSAALVCFLKCDGTDVVNTNALSNYAPYIDNAVLFGSPTFTTAGTYSELTLTSKYLQYAQMPTFLLTNSGFAFACWFRSNNNAVNTRLFEFGNGTNSFGVTVNTSTSANQLEYFINGVATRISTTTINSNTLNHFVFMFSALSGTTTTVTAYLNNSSVYTASSITYPTIGNMDFCYIGGSFTSTNPTFNGGISDIFVYSRVLSAGEISYLHLNRGVGFTTTSNTSTATNVSATISGLTKNRYYSVGVVANSASAGSSSIVAQAVFTPDITAPPTSLTVGTTTTNTIPYTFTPPSTLPYWYDISAVTIPSSTIAFQGQTLSASYTATTNATSTAIITSQSSTNYALAMTQPGPIRLAVMSRNGGGLFYIRIIGGVWGTTQTQISVAYNVSSAAATIVNSGIAITPDGKRLIISAGTIATSPTQNGFIYWADATSLMNGSSNTLSFTRIDDTNARSYSSVAITNNGNRIAALVYGSGVTASGVYFATWNGINYGALTRFETTQRDYFGVSLSFDGSRIAYGGGTGLYWAAWNGTTYSNITAITSTINSTNTARCVSFMGGNPNAIFVSTSASSGHISPWTGSGYNSTLASVTNYQVSGSGFGAMMDLSNNLFMYGLGTTELRTIPITFTPTNTTSFTITGLSTATNYNIYQRSFGFYGYSQAALLNASTSSITLSSIYFNSQTNNTTTSAENTSTGNGWIEVQTIQSGVYDMFFGTGDFTIEFYLNVAAGSIPSYPRLFSIGKYANPVLAVEYAGTTLRWYKTHPGSPANTTTTNSVIADSMPTNVWRHYSFSRQSSTTYVHINGGLILTFADSTNYTYLSSENNYFTINNESTKYAGFGGYMVGFTVIKGLGLYGSSNFTPRTTPLKTVASPGILLLSLVSDGTDLLNYGIISRSPYILTSGTGAGTTGTGKLPTYNNTTLPTGYVAQAMAAIPTVSVNTLGTTFVIINASSTNSTVFSYYTSADATLVNGVSSPFTISGLTPSTAYTIYVRAGTDATNWSNYTGLSITTSEKAAVPTLQLGTVSRATAVIIASSTNSSVFSYYTSANATPVNGVSSPITLSGLTASTTYTVYVRAGTNADTWSSYTSIELTTNAQNATPTVSVNTLGSTFVAINATSIDTTVFSYYTSADATPVNGVSSPFTISGLTQLTAYTIYVRAGTDGTNWSSYTSISVTTIETAAAPTLSLGTINATSTVINATSTNSSVFSYYTSINATPVNNVSSPFTVSGLNANTSYTVYVRAGTSLNWSSYTSISFTTATPAGYSIFFNVQNTNSETANTSTGNSWISVDMVSNGVYDMWFGTGDFTIEFYMNVSASSDPWAPPLFAIGSTSTFRQAISLEYRNVNGSFLWGSGGDSTKTATLASISPKTAWAPTKGSWMHYAVSKVSGVVYVFINGLLQIGISNPVNYVNTGTTGQNRFYINGQSDKNVASFGGNMIGFTIIKGLGLYTSNFTPRTTPITSVETGTLLLSLVSNGTGLVNYGIVPLSNIYPSGGSTELGLAPTYTSESLPTNYNVNQVPSTTVANVPTLTINAISNTYVTINASSTNSSVFSYYTSLNSTPINGVSSPIVVSGLTANTAYTIYVRAGTNSTTWSTYTSISATTTTHSLSENIFIPPAYASITSLSPNPYTNPTSTHGIYTISDGRTLYGRSSIFTNIGSVFTVQFWFRPTTNMPNWQQTLFDRGLSTKYTLTVEVVGSVRTVKIIRSLNSSGVVLSPAIPINAWTHITIVSNASNMWNLYLNGSTSSTDQTTANANHVNQIMKFAETFETTSNLYIAELRVWNIELTTTQLSANYNTEVASGTNGLVGLYRFRNGQILYNSV